MKTHIGLVICNLLLAVQTQGQSCSNCCEPGAQGTTGPYGIEGVKGPGGIPGRPGKHGMAGYSGEKGDLGPAGVKGQAGIKGNHGRLGLPGPDGLWHGDDGVAGEIGVTGTAGPAGIPGEQGHSGHHGHTGNDGPPGHPRAVRPSTFHTIFDGLGVWATTDNFIIPFNLVLENEGTDYSRNTGKYTAPVNGTYFLSTTVHKKIENPKLQVSIELYEFSTSTQRVITYLLLDSVEGDDSSTLEALVHLNANDQVFVTISHEQALQSDTRRKTSFTGYLLMDDY